MTQGLASRPVADGLFEGPPGEPVLLAGRCRECGTWVFPTPASCPRCSSESIEGSPLPREGTLWSFTVQHFQPKTPYDGPSDFEPYAVGYVEFEDKVLVEGRLIGLEPTGFEIGSAMEVCVFPYTADTDGTEVLTFGFRPVAS